MGAGDDVLAAHRRRCLEALTRQAGGQPLCGMESRAPGLKRGEGAVSALSQVARRHRAQPREGLAASAAGVLQDWTTGLEHRQGQAWTAYREGGEQAIIALAADLADLERG